MLILNYTKRTPLRTTILAVFSLVFPKLWPLDFVFINHLLVYINIYVVYGTPFSLYYMIMSDLLPDLPVCVYGHLYAHTNSKIKRVLDTNI